jgi:hypothetical protein
VLLCLVAAPSAALAQEEGGGAIRLPVGYAARPLTLPRLVLAPEAAFTVLQLPGITVMGTTTTPDAIVALGFGAAFGVTDDLQVDALLLPFTISPEANFGDPELGATLRFLRSTVEMGARVSISLPVQTESDFGIDLGLPVLVHVGAHGRLDTGFFVGMVFANDTVIAERIPIAYTHDLTESLFVGLDTGVGVEKADFDTLTVPLGLHVGYTIPSATGPMLEIGGRFAWPWFLLPGASDSKVNADIYELGVVATYFIYL